MAAKSKPGESKRKRPAKRESGQIAEEPKRIGRPCEFTEEIADEICRRLYESDENELPESLRKICRDDHLPDRRTVHRWLNEIPGFRLQYASARELRKDALLDRLEWLSRTALSHATGMPGTGEAGARVQAVKLEIDAIKWILSKEYPREYGELIKQEVSGPEGGPIQTQSKERSAEEIAAFAELLAKADATARPPT